MLVLLTQSVDAILPAGALMLTGRAGTSVTLRSVGMKIAPTLGTALLLGACHYSSLKEFADDVNNTGNQLVAKTKQGYEKIRSKLSEQFGNVEFVDKKIEQNGGDNKAWVGGKAGDINHVTNHYYGKRTFSDNFFEWIKTGGQPRAAATGMAVGTIGGYSLHSAITPKQEPKVVERIIVVPAATASQN